MISFSKIAIKQQWCLECILFSECIPKTIGFHAASDLQFCHSHIPGPASLGSCYSSFIGLTFLLWLVHKGSVLIPSLYLRLNADTVVCCLCGLNSSGATGHAYFTHCTFVDWTFRTYWSCAYTTPSFSDQFQTFACVWLFLTKSRSA